jgi:hypothetical protein
MSLAAAYAPELSAPVLVYEVLSRKIEEHVFLRGYHGEIRLLIVDHHAGDIPPVEEVGDSSALPLAAKDIGFKNKTVEANSCTYPLSALLTSPYTVGSHSASREIYYTPNGTSRTPSPTL